MGPQRDRPRGVGCVAAFYGCVAAAHVSISGTCTRVVPLVVGLGLIVVLIVNQYRSQASDSRTHPHVSSRSPWPVRLRAAAAMSAYGSALPARATWFAHQPIP